MRVALTFDAEHPDGSGHSHVGTEQVLGVLETYGAKATFFIQGRWAKAHPRLTERIVEQGHLIANHSHYHVPFPLLTHQGMTQDLEASQAVIEDATGVRPRFFRPPFGKTSPAMERAASKAGLVPVLWTVSSKDWTSSHSDSIVGNVMADLQQDSIVLFHTWPSETPHALLTILSRLPDLEPVGVDGITCPGTCYICGEDIPCALKLGHEGDCSAVSDG